MSIMRRAAYAAGMMIRETGQALDRAGSRLQGSYAFKEKLSRHRQVMNLEMNKPIISSDVFLAPNATLIGNVEVHSSASVWYGAVVRADTAPIQLCERSIVSDRAVIHGASRIGESALIGAGAIVAGAHIGTRAVVEAGSVVSARCVIGAGSVVRAGSVVSEGVSVPEGEIWAGLPAVKEGMVSDDARQLLAQHVERTHVLASAHADECGKTHDQIEAEKLRQSLMEERSEDYDSHLGVLGREAELVEIQAKLIEGERETQRKVGAA